MLDITCTEAFRKQVLPRFTSPDLGGLMLVHAVTTTLLYSSSTTGGGWVFNQS